MSAAARLDQLHLHIGIAIGVLGQECRKNGFDLHRRGRHFQHPGVSAPERLCLRAERADIAQQAAATSEQLLAFCGQDKTAPNAIEKLEAELLLKIADLPGKSRLGNAQDAARPWKPYLARPR